MKHKIILEIRKIAGEIESSNSFSTTVLKEKILNLHNKLVVLEFLENSIEKLASSDDSDKHNSEIETKEQSIDYSETIDFVQETIVETTTPIDEKDEDDITSDKNNLLEVIEDDKVEGLNTEEKVEEAIEATDINGSFDTNKSSLHNELKKKTIQIGLNDRIAFVKKLFDGDQQDFHRVLSQVNSFSEIGEVREFIDTYVKPEHNWDNYPEYADRFMEIIESKFE